MFERGWDILDYFRGVRPWDQLERLVARLPQGSHYSAQRDNDDEYVEMLAEFGLLPEDDHKQEIPLEGYTPEIARLDSALDALNNLALVYINSKSKKTQKLKPQPRPETAYQRHKRKQRERNVESIFAQMAPHAKRGR